MNSTPATRLQRSPRWRQTLHADGSVTAEPTGAMPSAIEAPPADASPANTPVSAVMTCQVLCVTPDVTLDALLTLMIERGISGVPVVSERGLPIGMVTKTDVVRHRYENGNTDSSDETRVSDLMIPIAHTLLESASLAHAAALIAWEGVHRLPICSDRGDVVGILSTLDVVRWMSRREGYSARRAGALSAPLVDWPR